MLEVSVTACNIITGFKDSSTKYRKLRVLLVLTTYKDKQMEQSDYLPHRVPREYKGGSGLMSRAVLVSLIY